MLLYLLESLLFLYVKQTTNKCVLFSIIEPKQVERVLKNLFHFNLLSYLDLFDRALWIKKNVLFKWDDPRDSADERLTSIYFAKDLVIHCTCCSLFLLILFSSTCYCRYHPPNTFHRRYYQYYYVVWLCFNVPDFLFLRPLSILFQGEETIKCMTVSCVDGFATLRWPLPRASMCYDCCY